MFQRLLRRSTARVLVHFGRDAGDPSRAVILAPSGTMQLAAFLAEHDIVVNCVLQDTDAPLMLVTSQELGLFASGSLVVDVSCDEGMGFEWARPTSFEDPMRIVGAGIHYYAVDHSPSYLWDFSHLGNQRSATAVPRDSDGRTFGLGRGRDDPPGYRHQGWHDQEPQDSVLPGPVE